MDIPDTGAVFTLGKSHLAENTQSYFYIKNDPVKRLISGPHQSAVICESGRLFVWGENRYGQLGIGNNESHNNDYTAAGQYVTKPTCVKSLKTLGLKIADVSFGIGWTVLLTHSNEFFFTGRNIFPDNARVSQNFHTTIIADEEDECSVIHKPFRLAEFDDCLSKSEEEENFVYVRAGNDHFAALTSLGRLIGWGSNDNYQLGTARQTNGQIHPVEIITEAKVHQLICGPYSTLVLTDRGQLYLTGRLNDFVFPQLTELQQNLSTHEHCIYVYISQSSDIYIVTNVGNIYRSIESVRHKSLIFQPFYDYNSEENGATLKLQCGAAFCVVLTKGNKLYTTFSESGHHLKTFREISKLKNLRLLDVAVGEQHILVHGVPKTKSSALAEQNSLSQTFITPNSENLKSIPIVEHFNDNNHIAISNEDECFERGSFDMEEASLPLEINGNHDHAPQENFSPIISDRILVEETVNDNFVKQENILEVNDLDENKLEVEAENKLIESGNISNKNDHELETMKSMEGGNTFLSTDDSLRNLEIAEEIVNIDLNAQTSPTNSVHTPKGSERSIKFDEESLQHTPSPNSVNRVARPRTPYPESSGSTSTPQTVKKAKNQHVPVESNEDSIENTSPAFNDSLENISEVTDSITVFEPTPPSEEDEELTLEISTTRDALDQTLIHDIRFINNGIDVTNNVEKRGSIQNTKIDSIVSSTVEDVENFVEEEKPASIKNTKSEVKANISESLSSMQKLEERGTKRMEDVTSESKLMTESTLQTAEDALKTGFKADNLNTLQTPSLNKNVNGNKDENEYQTKRESPTSSTELKPTGGIYEEDERTTASVNSNRTSSNPFENELDKPEITTNSARIASEGQMSDDAITKGKVRQFFSDMTSKGKSLSCRNDKAVRVDDEPPKYSVTEENIEDGVNTMNKTSKVCTIL